MVELSACTSCPYEARVCRAIWVVGCTTFQALNEERNKSSRTIEFVN
jgi:hypothetical protein